MPAPNFPNFSHAEVQALSERLRQFLALPTDPEFGGTGARIRPTAGQLLIGTDAGVYVPAKLTAGANVTLTFGNGRITIASSGGGGGGSIVVQEDDANVDTSVTTLDFTEPDATLVTSAPAGEANINMALYALLTGRAGGQSIRGGTGAGEDLTLVSTGHGTKDRIFFGATQQSCYDEVNFRFGVNQPVPTNKIHTRGTNDTEGVTLEVVANSGSNPNLIFQKARGTIGAEAAPSSGDNLGFVMWRGYNSGYQDAAFLCATTSEAWGVGAQGARLRFATTANGSTSRSIRMVIDHNGNVGINEASPGAKLEVSDSATSLTAGIQITNTSTAVGSGKINSLEFRGTDTVGTEKQAVILAPVLSDENWVNAGLQAHVRDADTVREKLRITPSGKVGVMGTSGSAVTAPAVGLEVQGTDAILIPKGTTGQEPSPVTGYFRHDTSTGKLRYVEGAAFEDVIKREQALGITIDGGGTAITTGVKGYITVPFNCTITGWDIFADQSGSIVIDVWKDSYANFPPTVADTIAGTEKPTLSSAQKNQDNSLSTWTTSLTAGDIIAFNVDSALTVTRVHLIIKVRKT